MFQTRRIAILMSLLIALTAAAVSAAPRQSFLESPKVQEWLEVYDEVNGDRNVVLELAPTRFLLTERTALTGFVKLDLIGGNVVVELRDLDREVDVWALDNAAHSSILPGDKGDRLVHLARVAPGEGEVVRVEKSLGRPAFRGFQVDWVLVSVAGADPAESRLSISSRTLFERIYTQQRLAREGFDVAVPPRPRPNVGGKAISVVSGGNTKGFGIASRPHRILVTKGLVTQQEFDGADVFFRETFEGNGRSCGTCHPAENNQTIDGPDFLANLPDSDPLFIAEQVPPYHPISQLEVPKLMRELGLIVENVDGAEDPTVKFLMRGVPHSLSLATSTNPDDGVRTGWSGDGAPAPGTIRMFLTGATMQHYPKNNLDRTDLSNFRLPTDEELDDNVVYMLSVGRLEDIDLGGVSLNNPNAANGLAEFIPSGCNACHQNAGAGASFAGGANLNLNTNVEVLPAPGSFIDPTPLDRTDYPGDGGFGTAVTTCPNGTECFGDGTFNTTPLVEAADTAPLFHNNAAADIEAGVRFYTGPPFGNPIPFDEPTVQDVAAFLRVLNAAFNVQLAIQRNEAALVLIPGPFSTETTTSDSPDSNGVGATANKLLSLSNDENDDAIRVLIDGPLGNLDASAVYHLQQARSLNKQAIGTTSNSKRRDLVLKAVSHLNSANASLGSGMDFNLGSGNLLF